MDNYHPTDSQGIPRGPRWGPVAQRLPRTVPVLAGGPVRAAGVQLHGLAKAEPREATQPDQATAWEEVRGAPKSYVC